MGPPDIEERIGLTGGHIFQGQALPSQMWDRRLQARTPIDGLYLCGAATHPGGSVIALNGRIAAGEVLAATRARRPPTPIQPRVNTGIGQSCFNSSERRRPRFTRPLSTVGPMRRLFLLVAAVILVDTTFYSAITPLLPQYADDLGLSKTAAGVLSASYAAGTLLAALPSGFLAARIGFRSTMLAGPRPARRLVGRLRLRRGRRRPRPRPLRRGRRRGLRLDRRPRLAARRRAGRPPRRGDRRRAGSGDLRHPARPGDRQRSRP